MIDQLLKSYQELIDCCYPKEKKVNLYHYPYAFDYFKIEGIPVMSQYEFTSVKGNCKPKSALKVIRKQFLLFIIIIILSHLCFFIYFILLFFQKQQAIYVDKDKLFEVIDFTDEAHLIECIREVPICAAMEVTHGIVIPSRGKYNSLIIVI